MKFLLLWIRKWLHSYMVCVSRLTSIIASYLKWYQPEKKLWNCFNVKVKLSLIKCWNKKRKKINATQRRHFIFVLPISILRLLLLLYMIKWSVVLPVLNCQILVLFQFFFITRRSDRTSLTNKCIPIRERT